MALELLRHPNTGRDRGVQRLAGLACVARVTVAGQFRQIASMRPTGGWGTGVGQSLRGTSSEFFPAPLRNGQRIECTGGGNSSCARSEANSFCRSVGWTMARTQTVESVDRRSVVADVLCSRTPF